MKNVIVESVVEYISDASGVKMESCELTEHSCTVTFAFGYGEYPKDCPPECDDMMSGKFDFTREEAIEIWKMLKDKYPKLTLHERHFGN